MKLESLLAALREMFGPRLGFGAVMDDQLPMLWGGIEEGTAWLGDGTGPQEEGVWRLLSAAHDAALEGRGTARRASRSLGHRLAGGRR